jgi:hypothetical protein
MIDCRLRDRAEYPVGHIGRTRNLQEVPSAFHAEQLTTKTRRHEEDTTKRTKGKGARKLAKEDDVERRARKARRGNRRQARKRATARGLPVLRDLCLLLGEASLCGLCGLCVENVDAIAA